MTDATEIVVVADLPALADEAAARIERVALEASPQGRATIALAGGGTPKAAYQHLAGRCPPWGRVEFFFGDERCVPPDAEGSNESSNAAVPPPLTYTGSVGDSLRAVRRPRERAVDMASTTEPMPATAVLTSVRDVGSSDGPTPSVSSPSAIPRANRHDGA